MSIVRWRFDDAETAHLYKISANIDVYEGYFWTLSVHRGRKSIWERIANKKKRSAYHGGCEPK